MNDVKRIAIPIRNGRISGHMGRCEGLIVGEINTATDTVGDMKTIRRPQTGCESIPQWLKQLGINLLLTRRLGDNARQSLAGKRIEVSAGWTQDDPSELIASYLAGNAPDGDPHCGTSEHDDHHCRKRSK